MRSVFRTLLVVGIICEIGIVISARLLPTLSYRWMLVPLVVIFLALTLLFAGMVADRRSVGSWAISLSYTTKRFGVPRKALALLISELNSLSSITKIFKQSTIPTSGEAHSGYKNLRTVVYVVFGLVIIEIIIVHIAISNGMWRILLLVMSTYGVLLLLGFYTSIRVNPHVLTSQGLKLRHGNRFICEIPWDNLLLAKRVGPGQGDDISFSKDGGVRLPVLSEVNMRLELKTPVSAEDLHKGRVDISSIEIYCDDSKAFLDSIMRAQQLYSHKAT